MKNANFALVLGLTLLLFGGVGWMLLSGEREKSSSIFLAEGTLAKDSPGYEKGVWYLVYEEPGFPAISIALEFDTESVCAIEGRSSVCDMSFVQGDKVYVQGDRSDDSVLVNKLSFTAPKARNIPVRLYFYDEKKDTDENGEILCSKRGLVEVDRLLPHTETPLYETIKLLLSGDISEVERAIGLKTEYPLKGVRLEKAAIVNSVATLTFSDAESKTSGGACRANVLWAQVEATAKQFPSVRSVRYEPLYLFQP